VRAGIDGDGVRKRRERRGRERLTELCSGPGKLTQACGIWLDENGTSLARGPVKIRERSARWCEPEIAVGTRIGITHAVELPWRFAAAGDPNVSRPRI